MDNIQAAGFTPAAAFNIADFEARDTAWLDVQNKADDGPLLVNDKPVRILVRSPGTREALNAQHRQEQAATTKTLQAMRGKAPKETVDDKIAQGAEKLIAITAEIENFPISARELHTNPKLAYISRQVAEFHADWGNF